MIKRFHPIIICILISLILFIGKQPNRLNRAAFLSKFVYYPFISTVNSAKEYLDLRSKNEILLNKVTQQQIKIASLENKIQKFQNTEFPNDNDSLKYVISDVIGFQGSFQQRNIIVNSGAIKNITENLPVISVKGVVGKTIAVAQNYSVVLTANHPSFKLAVMNKGTRVQGMLEVDVNGKTFMNMIPIGSEISIGDTIVTSNISTIFPKGYLVGIIDKIVDTPDVVFIKAGIKLFEDVNKIEQVAILILNKEDIIYDEKTKYQN